MNVRIESKNPFLFVKNNIKTSVSGDNTYSNNFSRKTEHVRNHQFMLAFGMIIGIWKRGGGCFSDETKVAFHTFEVSCVNHRTVAESLWRHSLRTLTSSETCPT